mgnify:CR=1 FL=1
MNKQLTEYISWVNELKNLIQKTQIKAAISVNRELLGLYWSIGKSIVERFKSRISKPKRVFKKQFIFNEKMV